MVVVLVIACIVIIVAVLMRRNKNRDAVETRGGANDVELRKLQQDSVNSYALIHSISDKKDGNRGHYSRIKVMSLSGADHVSDNSQSAASG